MPTSSITAMADFLLNNKVTLKEKVSKRLPWELRYYKNKNKFIKDIHGYLKESHLGLDMDMDSLDNGSSETFLTVS